MDFEKRVVFIFLLLLAAWQKTGAQSLNGQVIYISESNVMVLKFGSTIDNYTYDTQEARELFQTQPIGKRSLSIRSMRENFKPANLHIIEGRNTHLFILKYKANLDENERLDYDYSTKAKLREAVDELERQRSAPNPQPDSTKIPADTAKARVNTQPVITKTPDPVLPAEDKNEKRFTELRDNANTAFKAGRWEEAKKGYEAARAIKPQDQWCNDQLKKIDQRLGEDLYQKYMKKGREDLANESFDSARAAFNMSLQYKPNDAAAKKELARVDVAKAASAKKQQANQQTTVLQNRYNGVIAIADNMYDAGMYDDARKEYTGARTMMPGQSYPVQRIKSIDSIFAERKKDRLKIMQDSMNVVNAVKMRQDSINRQYTLSIQRGTAAIKKNDYKAAKEFFENAALLKPAESAPATQLALVNKKLEEIALDQKYALFMRRGDSMSRTVKDYKAARRWYDSARSTKPDEPLPPKQLRAMDRIIFVQDSTAKEQEEKQVRDAKFNQVVGIYYLADTARLERKYAEAYKGFRGFLAGINMQQKDKYAGSQRYCIDRALEYIKSLEPYYQTMLEDSTRKARQQDSLKNLPKGRNRRKSD